MDKNIVGQALKNAKRLMNNAEFDRKVNGYVNEGAGGDGYMPSSPRRQPQSVEEAYDPMDYTQMASAGINTKLPKNILESMLNNPINVTPANSGFGSVLGNLDTDELERSTPAQLPRRRLNESAPVQQMPSMQPAGIDSNYLKFLVKEAVKECMDDLKKELLSETTIKGFKMGANNKLMFIDGKNNLWEGEMKLKKKAQ
jgi:hypothetical protein